MPANDKTELILDGEAAVQVVQEMTTKYLIELGGVDLYTGQHPQHGNIRVLVPSAGKGIILYPFDLQSTLS